KISEVLLKQIKEVIIFGEETEGSNGLSRLSAVKRKHPGLGWVAVLPKPVLKEYKDVNKKHVDWVKAYSSIWTELKMGPVAKELRGLLSGPSAGSGPQPTPVSTSSGSDESVSLSALFVQINSGESITNALKHVSDDMKTRKNPALKAQSGPVHSGPKPFSVPKPQITVLELEGKKWRVENQENVSNLVIDDTELKQMAYIHKCVNTTLQIKGKINSITEDNCKKYGLVFNDMVGIVEIINSRDVKVQVMGKVPNISINKTDGCHAYLSKNSLDCDIVSAKSSEMNILIPTEFFNEFPKLVSTVTEIAE
uniref:Adenylyl cyclase-associated protein 1 n=1 Tax=Aotus nancymaae TaxID=37293 RepID=A0A2K5C8M8_AOTNA